MAGAFEMPQQPGMSAAPQSAFAPGASGGGSIPTADVVALLQGLASAGPDAIAAVSQMLMAASQGQPIDADVQSLGIDPAVLSRVLEAAGGG